VNADARPTLSRKAKLRTDRLTGDTLLLYPEHGLVLNESAAAIVRLCDGRAVRDIAAALDAPLADVIDLLEALAERGLVKEAS
jgi:pyrroloquinoline quinone biosynthesis protein D